MLLGVRKSHILIQKRRTLACIVVFMASTGIRKMRKAAAEADAAVVLRATCNSIINAVLALLTQCIAHGGPSSWRQMLTAV